MKLHELKSTPNSRKSKMRKGRGTASKGKTAGRGMNGQNARSGGGVRPGFEGGQNPWFRRLPKRGFKNINHIEYQVVNVSSLELKFKNDDLVDVIALKKAGLISKIKKPVKILGDGELTKKLSIQVDKISKSAMELIKKNGGTILK